MKKTIIMTAMALSASMALSAPHGPGPGRPGVGGHRPPPPPPAHHHHGSVWGRGGSNFWPGFVGGVIGGALARPVVHTSTTVVATPTIVTTPVVTTTPVIATPVVTTPAVVTPPVVVAPAVQNVWVEGRYVDQIQANGAVLRVWQPGHYEQRTVVVQ